MGQGEHARIPQECHKGAERAGSIGRCAAIAVATALFAPTMPVAAQTLPDPTEELRRQQQRGDAQRQRLEPAAPDSPAQTPKPTARLAWPAHETPCFEIRSVALIGASAADLARFQGELDDGLKSSADETGRSDDSPIGRCLGARGVAVAAQRINALLAARGWITTQVGLGPQNLADGVLRLELTPGRIARIVFSSEHTPPRPHAVLPLRSGNVLELRDLEQAIENLRRVPSAAAEVAVQPGAQPGESDLIVQHQQPRAWRLSGTLDDGGSPSTGRYQAGATLSWDSPLRLGDLFYLSVNHHLPVKGGEPHGTRGRAIHYSVPWGYTLWSINAQQSRYHQSIAGLNQNYIYSGTTQGAEVKLAHVLWRNQTRKVTGSLRAYTRGSRNFIEDTEVLVQKRRVGGWELGLQWRERIGSGALDASATLRRGTGAFGAMRGPEEAFGEGSSRAAVLLADIQWSTPFQAFGRDVLYTFALRGQATRERLVPQDLFAIGGRYTVRGFDGRSSLAGEQGWLMRHEWSLATALPGVQTYLGIDHGEVHATALQQVGRRLTGAVLGVRAGLGSISLDVSVAAPLHKPAQFQTSPVTTAFTLNAQF